MAIEIMHGKDYLSVTNSLDKTHKLVIEENGKQLLYSIEFKNEHNTYFDDEDKRLIEKNITNRY
ncbi:hypothetical protein [Vagococcus fluvialis]|uniref:hypothetical protein n=1 Tax=Vagococcus fluvialis TaxID=2738 RepID=UPI003D125F2C